VQKLTRSIGVQTETVRFQTDVEEVKQEVNNDMVQDKKPEIVTQTDVEEMKQELVSEVAKDMVQERRPEIEKADGGEELKEEVSMDVDEQDATNTPDSSKEEQTTLTQASQDSMADAEELLYGEIAKTAAKSQVTLAKARAEVDEPVSNVLAPDDERTIFEVVLLLLAQVEAEARADRVSPPFSLSPPSPATALLQVRENPLTASLASFCI
jgi:hypothetical protein